MFRQLQVVPNLTGLASSEPSTTIMTAAETNFDPAITSISGPAPTTILATIASSIVEISGTAGLDTAVSVLFRATTSSIVEAMATTPALTTAPTSNLASVATSFVNSTVLSTFEAAGSSVLKSAAISTCMADSSATSLPGIVNGTWRPDDPCAGVTNVHMSIAVFALIFYGVIILISLFFMIIRNRCRIFKDSWWLSLTTVCICRIVSSAMTIEETLQAKDTYLYTRRMYGAAIVNDILCLVALYNLHLSFVERLCHAVGKWSMVALCFWLTIAHLVAEPFLIAATWKTNTGRQVNQQAIDTKIQQKFAVYDYQRQSDRDEQDVQVGLELLLVGLTIGIFCFVVQSTFALAAATQKKTATKDVRLFEMGVLVMIPLVAARVVSVVFMFWSPVWDGVLVDGHLQGDDRDGHDYVDYQNNKGQLKMHRVYIEIIPEVLSVLLALLLASLAPKGVSKMTCSRDKNMEKNEVLFRPDLYSMPQPGAPGMAFTPLKLNSTNILMHWYNAHLNCPFPSEQEKQDLVLRTGFTLEMIDIWFEDTRACTRLQNIEDENNGTRSMAPFNSTDGVYEVSETRPVLFRTILVPPPVMLGPRPHSRIITPPSGPIVMRMPLPCAPSAKPLKASTWTVVPHLMDWAMRSLRVTKPLAQSRYGTTLVRHTIPSNQGSNTERVMEEGIWMQPRVLSRRISTSAIQDSKRAMKVPVPGEFCYKGCPPPVITVEDWDTGFPAGRSSVTIRRIRELTSNSSDGSEQLD